MKTDTATNLISLPRFTDFQANTLFSNVSNKTHRTVNIKVHQKVKKLKGFVEFCPNLGGFFQRLVSFFFTFLLGSMGRGAPRFSHGVLELLGPARTHLGQVCPGRQVNVQVENGLTPL